MLELKRDGHARVQTEMVEFIALPFSSSGLVISRSRVGNGKNVQKSVIHLLHFDAIVAVAVASFVRSLKLIFPKLLVNGKITASRESNMTPKKSIKQN